MCMYVCVYTCVYTLGVHVGGAYDEVWWGLVEKEVALNVR